MVLCDFCGRAKTKERPKETFVETTKVIASKKSESIEVLNCELCTKCFTAVSEHLKQFAAQLLTTQEKKE